MIYIKEAHATDIWPIGLSAGVLNESHKSITDRNLCASNFVSEFEFKYEVYLDNMKNTFMNTFKVWPFRLIIIKDKKLCYSSVPRNSEYDILELYEFFNSK